MTPKRDYEEIKEKMGKRSAKEFVKASSSTPHEKALQRKMKKKFYIGHSTEPRKREVFSSHETPTKESHPQYGHVRGGYKTKKEAENIKNYY